MRNVLVVGGTRGLGAALVAHYASQPSTTVYATTRSSTPPQDNHSSSPSVKWINSIDLTQPSCAPTLVSSLTSTPQNIIYIVAGIFHLETFSNPDWDAEVATYTTSAIAPVFLISALFHAHLLPYHTTPPTKIILVSSEAGSLALSSAGGGGNYAHHASKSALNMAGLQLHYDLKEYGVAVGMVHPSFMRTEMTKNVGFDVAWEENDALTPEEAAGLVANWTEGEFGLDKAGELWAPRGSRDIGSWRDVMGEHVKGPVKLPW